MREAEERWTPDPDRARRVGEDFRGAREEPSDPRRKATRRVGGSLRSLIDRVTATDAPADVLDRADAKIAEVAALLDGYTSGRSYAWRDHEAGLDHDVEFFDWSPVAGRASPLAPPLTVDVEDGEVVGTVRFGIAYEGPPGCVHGGFVAAVFDEILGLVQSLSGQVGMTGSLTVKYRKPTPLFADLHFVGRVTGVSGRKVTAVAEIYDRDVLLAEATGLFVSLSPERFQAHVLNRERPA